MPTLRVRYVKADEKQTRNNRGSSDNDSNIQRRDSVSRPDKRKINKIPPKNGQLNVYSRVGGWQGRTFPFVLHEILDNAAHSSYIQWLPDGLAWTIKDMSGFAADVCPLYFRHANYRSFMQNVRNWDFKQDITDDGTLVYRHHHFVRDEPSRCRKMSRAEKKNAGAGNSKSKKKTTESCHEPSEVGVFMVKVDEEIKSVNHGTKSLNIEDRYKQEVGREKKVIHRKESRLRGFSNLYGNISSEGERIDNISKEDTCNYQDRSDLTQYLSHSLHQSSRVNCNENDMSDSEKEKSKSQAERVTYFHKQIHSTTPSWSTSTNTNGFISKGKAYQPQEQVISMSVSPNSDNHENRIRKRLIPMQEIMRNPAHLRAKPDRDQNIDMNDKKQENFKSPSRIMYQNEAFSSTNSYLEQNNRVRNPSVTEASRSSQKMLSPILNSDQLRDYYYLSSNLSQEEGQHRMAAVHSSENQYANKGTSKEHADNENDSIFNEQKQILAQIQSKKDREDVDLAKSMSLQYGDKDSNK